jgi:hypothetical protein
LSIPSSAGIRHEFSRGDGIVRLWSTLGWITSSLRIDSSRGATRRGNQVPRSQFTVLSPEYEVPATEDFCTGYCVLSTGYSVPATVLTNRLLHRPNTKASRISTAGFLTSLQPENNEPPWSSRFAREKGKTAAVSFLFRAAACSVDQAPSSNDTATCSSPHRKYDSQRLNWPWMKHGTSTDFT